MVGRATILMIGLARLLFGLWLGFRPFDDSFITFRYAKNLAQGNGLVFNLGEEVLGTSTPLWALALGLTGWLGLDIPRSAFFLSLLLDVFTACFVADLVRGVTKRISDGFLAGLLFLCIADFLSIARAGMETSLFCSLLAGSLALAVRRQAWPSLLMAGLCCLARPEGVFVLSCAAALFTFGTPAKARVPVFRALAATVLALGLWVLIATAFYGSPVPTSVTAKALHIEADSSLESFSWTNLRLFGYLGQFGGAVFARTWLELRTAWSILAVLGVGAIAAGCWRRQEAGKRQAFILLVFLPAIYVGALAFANAFTWFPWYYGPLYLFLVPLVVLGAGAAADVAAGRNICRRKQATAVIVGVLVVAQFVAALVVKLPADREYWVAGYKDVLAGWAPPEGETVAALEVGTVGWQVWPAPVLDLVGLVSPEAIGREPADSLLASEARYLCVRTDDGAALLAAIDAQEGKKSAFRTIRSVQDPYVDRRFVLLERCELTRRHR